MPPRWKAPLPVLQTAFGYHRPKEACTTPWHHRSVAKPFEGCLDVNRRRWPLFSFLCAMTGGSSRLTPTPVTTSSKSSGIVAAGVRRVLPASCRWVWQETIGDPILADVIIDYLVAYAHRIDLDGESIRRTKSSPLILTKTAFTPTSETCPRRP